MLRLLNEFPRMRTARLLALGGLSAFVLAMNGCEGITWNEAELAASVRERGEIRVITIEHPLIYASRKASEDQGLDRDLLAHFADTYGLKLRFIIKKNVDDAYDALRDGEGDLAAARLWIPERSDGFVAGPVLEESHLSLFCRRRLKIRHVKDLSRRKVILAAKDNGDAFDARLRQFVADVDIDVLTSTTSRALLRRVSAGKADCAVLESLEGAFLIQMLPAVEKVTAMSGERALGWMLRPEMTDLRDLMNAWFQRASRDDDIMRIQDRYRASLSHLDSADVKRFLRNLRVKLPRYAKAFRESAAEHDLDWQLIAAIAYQESHWNQHAVSHTGVRGLMQLTNETAAAVGIEDRTDPLQSIWGGSFYVRKLLDRMPAGVDPQERLAMALAAYNCGIAHLRDAQALAAARGLNPFSWRHLRTVLPLLENEEIAASLPFGYARGRETVQFVDRVRGFQHLLHQLHD